MGGSHDASHVCDVQQAVKNAPQITNAPIFVMLLDHTINLPDLRSVADHFGTLFGPTGFFKGLPRDADTTDVCHDGRSIFRTWNAASDPSGGRIRARGARQPWETGKEGKQRPPRNQR